MSALITRATFGRPPGQEAPKRRYCRQCNGKLQSLNPGTICAYCNKGKWEEGTEVQIQQLRTERLEELGVAA